EDPIPAQREGEDLRPFGWLRGGRLEERVHALEAVRGQEQLHVPSCCDCAQRRRQLPETGLVLVGVELLEQEGGVGGAERGEQDAEGDAHPRAELVQAERSRCHVDEELLLWRERDTPEVEAIDVGELPLQLLVPAGKKHRLPESLLDLLLERALGIE